MLGRRDISSKRTILRAGMPKCRGGDFDGDSIVLIISDK